MSLLAAVATRKQHNLACLAGSAPTFRQTVPSTLERALFPDGSYLPSLVFKGTPPLPDMDKPTSIPIEGQYTGRNVSLVVKFGDDPTKWIFGNGYSTQDPFKPGTAKALIVAAGSTVGPEIGDQGDWQKLAEVRRIRGRPKLRRHLHQWLFSLPGSPSAEFVLRRGQCRLSLLDVLRIAKSG